MQKPVSFTKPAIDLFWTQFTWTLWAMGIILLVHIGRIFFVSDPDSFYSAAYISGNIYMLVIGIIVIYFLPYYVENGITRKHYFIGNVIASIGLSIIIPIFTYIISRLERLVVHNFTSIVINDRALEEVVVDMDADRLGNFIGEMIQVIILTPFVHPESNLLLSLALFSLHIFIFYLIGWMISAAFYRVGVIGGLIFIAIGLALMAIKDSMIRLALDLPLFQSFAALDTVPVNLALPLVFVVAVVAIVFIRLLTKRAPIHI